MPTCPACHGFSPTRGPVDQPCPSCRAQQAWSELGATRLVVDRAAIEAVERRRRGAVEPWWRRGLAWLPVAASGALATLAALGLVALFAARPVGPLAGLLADLTRASQRAALAGVVAVAGGVIGLGRLRRGRRFRWPPALVAHGLAVVVGLAAAVAGGGHWLLVVRGAGPRYTSMPARPALDVPVQLERIVDATAVVLAPDGDGDARGGALGTGTVIAADPRRAWILTCSHVAMPYAAVATFRSAQAARPVWVELADGRAGRGAVRWTAPPPLDVAVIELPIDHPPEPAPISLAGSELPAGASVTFVPNPYRTGWRVVHGQLIRREPHHTPAGAYDLLYTDLPITHGDSGSGLFDARGALIGINTWTVTGDDRRSRGISLPASTLRALVDVLDAGRPGDGSRLDALDDLLQRPPGRTITRE